MPLLNVVIKGDNVGKLTSVKTERPLKITYLKLVHIYHNLSSALLSDATDKSQQRVMFIKIGNLINSDKNTLTYVGDWDNMTAKSTNNMYDIDYDYIHGFCIGASKHGSSGEIVSKEMFQILYEDTNVLEWDGEFNVRLYYLDKEGLLKEWTKSQTYNATSNKVNSSFLVLQFEYHEE